MAGLLPTAGAPTTGGTTQSPGTSGAPAVAGTPAMGEGGSGGAPTQSPDPIPTLIGDVAFSTPSQTFKGELQVSMTTAVAGAEIRYTTDGTLPNASSPLYTGEPLVLTATTQLRAQPFSNGAPAGAVSTAIYIARTFDATSTLPIVVVDGYGLGKSTDKNLYLDAAVMIFEPVDGTASIAELPTVATRAGYHLRGQSSASFPQRPYRIEFWDNANEDADYPVMGMPADSDWALIPPYYDRSLIRNPFVYTLGKDLGLEAPRTAYAEVYINYEPRPLAETDYQGIYWFTETIKNAKVRTNLKQLREKDTMLPQITGGYIFKFDQLAAEEPKLLCTGADPIPSFVFGPRPGMGGMGGSGGAPAGGTCWIDLEVVDPDPLMPEQQAWITQYIQQFHDALHATPMGDYGAYIDVPSFVDYLIVNELTRNVDAYVRSAYYHKDRDGKIKAGPLWDYNFALAVGAEGTVEPNGGWQFEGGRNVNNWYPKLTSDPAFRAAVKARWQELRTGLLSQASLDQRITELAAPLTSAAAKDFAKWPVSTVYGQGQGFIRVVGPTAETWEGQVQALRDFVAARLTHMDTLVNAL